MNNSPNCVSASIKTQFIIARLPSLEFSSSFLPRVIDEQTPKKSSTNSYEFFMKESSEAKKENAILGLLSHDLLTYLSFRSSAMDAKLIS